MRLLPLALVVRQAWTTSHGAVLLNRSVCLAARHDMLHAMEYMMKRTTKQRVLHGARWGWLCWPCVAVAVGCSSLGPVVDPAATHAIPPFEIPPAQPGVTYVRFLATGDMGTGRADQQLVADVMADRAARDGIDFWLTLGDNFYSDGVASVDDPQWQTKFESVYAAESLQVPVYATLGNHDYGGNIQAQLDYTARNPNWNMPARFYTFSRMLDGGSTVQFFAIDTTPIHTFLSNPCAQLQWLDDALAASDADWKIVFGHHPLYSHGEHGVDWVMIIRLGPILAQRGVDVYFAGHDHTLEMLRPVDGVHHVVSGAGGGPDKAYRIDWTDDAFYAATLGGFVAVRVSADELVIEFVRLDGEAQYAQTLHR